jgi:hypothetical protein
MPTSRFVVNTAAQLCMAKATIGILAGQLPLTTALEQSAEASPRFLPEKDLRLCEMGHSAAVWGMHLSATSPS